MEKKKQAIHVKTNVRAGASYPKTKNLFFRWPPKPYCSPDYYGYWLTINSPNQV